MTPFALSSLEFNVERYGVLMAPQEGNDLEVEGCLNPAGVIGPDGHYYLFPRIVAAGNYSRIGLGRVRYDSQGRPCGVERLGIAIEPSESYEVGGSGIGGCEDARVTRVESLGLYIMCYTAFDGVQARIALATSCDLRAWRKRGVVGLAPEGGADFTIYPNKDAILFPKPVYAPNGDLSVVLMHRPIYDMLAETGAGLAWTPAPLPAGVTDDRPSIWLSYCALTDVVACLEDGRAPTFGQHTLLATPTQDWEAYRIGGGTAPLLTTLGWLTFYHGVARDAAGERCYQAGALILDRIDPRTVLFRTERPIFGPQGQDECVGVVNNVVFVEAAVEWDGGIDVYYGMADSRVGVVHLTDKVAAPALRSAA